MHARTAERTAVILDSTNGRFRYTRNLVFLASIHSSSGEGRRGEIGRRAIRGTIARLFSGGLSSLMGREAVILSILDGNQALLSSGDSLLDRATLSGARRRIFS